MKKYLVLLALISCTNTWAHNENNHYKMKEMEQIQSDDTDLSTDTPIEETPYDALHNETMQVMEQMHDAMNAAMNQKDADKLFSAGMLPHHIAAVRMAKLQLQYGKDPELRKLAKKIIQTQEGEIKLLQNWNKKHGLTPTE